MCKSWNSDEMNATAHHPTEEPNTASTLLHAPGPEDHSSRNLITKGRKKVSDVECKGEGGKKDFNFIYFIKLTGVTLVNKIIARYRFHVYNSIIHHLYFV